MNILSEILKWSKDRPSWQQDALRRFLVNDEFTELDIEELTELCKKDHGLSDFSEYLPLTKQHIPENSSKSNKISLDSIFHHKGVNALAESQMLKFGNNLTVVYGDNAAGKSGYTRILKEACSSRGAEQILGNVLSGTTPVRPTVSIKYRIGNEPDILEWTGKDNGETISRVSVFDTHAAAVYLNEKTDVAFRPFGLDLFDKLVKACQGVKKNIEREEASQRVSLIQNLEFHEGTKVAKLVSSISSLSDPKVFNDLANLTEQELNKIPFLEKRLVDLQTKNSVKLVQELALRKVRFSALTNKLKEIDEILSDVRIRDVFELQKYTQEKEKVAKDLREKTFPEGLLNGTGGDKWKELWVLAKEFSVETAYVGKNFPVTEEGAKCLLCQQDINPEAEKTLKQFEEFIQSVAEHDFRKTKELFRGAYKNYEKLIIDTDTINESIQEIRIEDASLADTMSSSLKKAGVRYAQIIKSLKDKSGYPEDLELYVSTKDQVETIVNQLARRMEKLEKASSPDDVNQINLEIFELKARVSLGEKLSLIIAEIERKKRIAAYGLCIKDTNTQRITSKSGALTKEVVTKQLQQSFSEELSKLRFRHVEVELQEAGGAQGNFYHKVALKRAPGVSVPKVVSEGEARCLSIAAFFAELSTADEESTIIFDDPVSSLDYKWRGGVAARLVEEAKHRQVIVFTHDIVFLLSLRQLAEDKEVHNVDQHIRQLPNIGSGVCKEELPWVAMPVKKRIGFLKNELQAAEKLHRDGHQDAYEKEAGQLYGLLREAWERGLEEVLLNGVVERYRKNIQTQQIRNISDISPEDCEKLERGMTKCSQWLVGHDQAPSAREDIPEPEELRADIASLEEWVTVIRQRR